MPVSWDPDWKIFPSGFDGHLISENPGPQDGTGLHFVGVILGGNNSQVTEWDGFTVVASRFEDGNEFPGLFNVWMYIAYRPASEGTFEIRHEHYDVNQGSGYAVACWLPEGTELRMMGPNVNPREISNVSGDNPLSYSYDLFPDSPQQVAGVICTSTSSATLPTLPDITDTNTDGLSEGPSTLTADVNDVYMRIRGFVLDGFLEPTATVEIADANPSERRWIFMAQPYTAPAPVPQGGARFAVY